MATRDSNTGPSIDDILADIRRQASAEQPHTDNDVRHDAEWHDPASGGAINVPASASGSASVYDFAAMEYDALDDHLEDLSHPALAQARNESHDLPSILKSPKHCAVVRPFREPSGRRLSDALRSAGLPGGTVLADGIERSQARLRKQFSTTSAPREAAAVNLVAVSDVPPAAHDGLADFDGSADMRDTPTHQSPAYVREHRPVLATEMCPAGSHALVLDAATLAEALEIDLVRSFRYRHAENASLDLAHDGAADLLRPMLRRWIDENMPRLIEVALDRELSRALPGSGYNRAS